MRRPAGVATRCVRHRTSAAPPGRGTSLLVGHERERIGSTLVLLFGLLARMRCSSVSTVSAADLLDMRVLVVVLTSDGPSRGQHSADGGFVKAPAGKPGAVRAGSVHS